MTTEQGFLFTTRGLAILLSVTALIALTYIPANALDAAHYWQLSTMDEAQRSTASDIYLFRVYLLHTGALVVQVVILSWAALWLCEGGPKLRHFFHLDTASDLTTDEGAREFFRRRAAGATGEGLRAALNAVPDNPPDPGDEL